MHRMKRVIFCLSPCLLLFGAAVVPVEGAEKKGSDPGDVVVATVAGEKITLADLDQFIEGLPENLREVARLRKKELLDGLVNRRLIFRHAEKRKLGNREEVKDYVRRARREIMIRLAVDELEKSAKPTENELKAAYKTNIDEYKQEGKVTAFHIMVATEKEAKDLIAKLKKGSDFAELAKKYSIAPERESGGSLGTMTRGHYKTTGLPQAIEEAAFALKPGSYSDAVKSEYGWHVVYTTSKDEARQKTFEEVRHELEKSLGEEKRSAALQSLLKKLGTQYKVKKYPDRIP